jgi:hypothetical protein
VPVPILIVAEDVAYDKTSCGLLNVKMIEVLDKCYSCTVLAPQPIPPLFLGRFSGNMISFSFHKPRWLCLVSAIPGLRSLVAYLTGFNHASYHKYLQWKRQLKALPAPASFHLVILLPTGMGYYGHHAWAGSALRHRPTAVHLHDPYPMAMLPAPQNAPWDFPERLLAWRFQRVLSKAAAVWSSSLRQLEWMEKKYPVLRRKGRVVPHLASSPSWFTNPNGQDPLPENEPPFCWHTRSHFLLVHMGSLPPGRDPSSFASALERFLLENPEAAGHLRFIFMGKVSPVHQKAFEQLAKMPQCHIDFHSRIPFHKAFALQKAATANLVIESCDHPSPQLFGKFADGVAANRPLFCIGPQDSEARRLLGANHPWQAANGNAKEIYAVLEKLYHSWAANREMSLGRSDLLEALHPQRLMEAVEELLQRQPQAHREGLNAQV